MKKDSGVNFPPSDCTMAELNSLAQVAGFFRDEGVICDLGCGNGGTTAALAIGLQSIGVAPKGQIHAFDWFDTTGKDHANLEKFKKNVSNYISYIKLHSENIIQSASWFDLPIEILFVDIAKSLDSHKASMRFLHNLTGDWFFLNQDAGRPHLTFIQYSISYLFDYAVGVDVIDDMVVIKGKGKIPELLIDKLSADDFCDEERLHGIKKFYDFVGDAEARNGVSYHALKNLTLAFYYATRGDKKEARLHFHEFRKIVPEAPRNLTAVVIKLSRMI